VFFIVLNDRTNLLGLTKQKNILVFFLFFIFPLKPLNSKVFRPNPIIQFRTYLNGMFLQSFTALNYSDFKSENEACNGFWETSYPQSIHNSHARIKVKTLFSPLFRDTKKE
jgi:hypothetical protein